MTTPTLDGARLADAIAVPLSVETAEIAPILK